VTELQWKPRIYLPVNLTVRFGAEVLKADDPEPWCHQQAVEKLGPRASRKQVSKLSGWLEDYAKHLRNKDLPTTSAMFFYPDFMHVRAFAEIYLVGPDPVIGPMTPARAREICGPDELSFGETEITETEVPVGRALRVHRFRKAEPAKRRTPLGEEVAWFIWPPDSTVTVMMFTRWMESAFSKPGTTIADDMASNLRIEPLEDDSE